MARQLLQSEPGICEVEEREKKRERERVSEEWEKERHQRRYTEDGTALGSGWGHLGEAEPARQKETG